MITPHTSLLQQLYEYVDEYIAYLFERSDGAIPEATADLHQIIDELEALQKHRDQRAEAEQLARRISDQLAHLRMLTVEPTQRRTLPSRPKQTLLDAFHAYFNQEIATWRWLKERRNGSRLICCSGTSSRISRR